MLARRREPARLLVVGTYRAAEVVVRNHPLKTVKHELIARGQGVEVALSYLSQADVDVCRRPRRGSRRGCRASPGDLPAHGRASVIYGAGDRLSGRGRGATLATPTVLVALEQALPPGLRELIEAQLGQLTAEEQQVLEVGVWQAVFAVASVAAGLQRSDVTIEAVCERLARREQFLEERELETWPDGMVSGRYGFRHALYQEVLYKRLGSGWQARLHRQIGTRLEHAYGERTREVAAELAVHFECGRDWQRAVQYLQQAAANAAQRHAPQEVIALLTKGVELLATLPETRERVQREVDMLIALGAARIATQGYAAPEVAQTYARARQLCHHLDDPHQLFPTLRGLWNYYHVRAEFRRRMPWASSSSRWRSRSTIRLC